MELNKRYENFHNYCLVEPAFVGRQAQSRPLWMDNCQLLDYSFDRLRMTSQRDEHYLNSYALIAVLLLAKQSVVHSVHQAAGPFQSDAM